MREVFAQRGWVQFETDPQIAAWAEAARAAGDVALADPALDHWYQCARTWFVGVDALPTDAAGRLPGGPELDGAPLRFIAEHLGGLPDLHPAQLSVVFPGYPQPREGESAAAARYRERRDAAHVDGLLPTGPARRRRFAEPHRWILGLPLTPYAAEAAPLVVWEGSHLRIHDAFRAALTATPRADWPRVDLTETYQTVRREIFETCPRRALTAQPGQAMLLDPLILHGVAPWTAPDGPGRMIAYFRPLAADGLPQLSLT